MSGLRLWILSVLSLVVFVPVARAPAASLAGESSLSPQGMNFSLEGKITRHTPGKLTVNTEGNIIFHVAYNDKTEIKRKDGSAGGSKDLQVGTRIHVDGDLRESGEIIAQKIAILPESAGEKQ